MLRLLLVLVAILAFHPPAAAQAPSGNGAGAALGRPAAPDRLIGLAVRLRDRDRVVGEVTDVIERDGGIGLVVQIEAQDHRPVLLAPNALEREGGKLYLKISEAALGGLPTFENGSGEPGSTGLPYGGTTPGWGEPQGGLPGKKPR